MLALVFIVYIIVIYGITDDSCYLRKLTEDQLSSKLTKITEDSICYLLKIHILPADFVKCYLLKKASQLLSIENANFCLCNWLHAM